MPPRFAIAAQEELWAGDRLIEKRLSHGEAAGDGNRIDATDAADSGLVTACELEMQRLRAVMPPGVSRVRLVAEARLEGVSSAMIVSEGRYAIVTTPDHLDQDLLLLRRAAAALPMTPAGDYRSVPILWTAGSAAVLFHEAVGHAAEHGEPPLSWPPWLTVRDGDADLLAGDRPNAKHRASFADVPLRRMTEIRAAQSDAPFELPPVHIEVLLVDGGAYEPMTQSVTVNVAAADLVDSSGGRCRLEPFEIRESREAVARAIKGAAGRPLRYPGVVCSREGQERVVASWAPLLLTSFA